MKADKVRDLEGKIKTLIEAEGFYCPKFFIVDDGASVSFAVNVYKDDFRKKWEEDFRDLYPGIADKVLNRWVSLGGTDLIILGVDSTLGLTLIRAKDRHGNEWLIQPKELELE